MKVLAVIPARKGSKRIKNKNFTNFAGKPLVEWTLLAAFESQIFTDIILSTDSQEDFESLSHWDLLDIGLRPKELSSDNATSISVINHAVKKAEKIQNQKYDVVVTLQPTSPLRTSLDIQNAFQIFQENNKNDSLISITEIPHIFKPQKVIQSLNEFIEFKRNYFSHNRQKYFAPNGAAIYITSRKILPHKLIGSNCSYYLMPSWRSIDIDSLEDFFIAELILNNLKMFNSL